MVLRRDRAQREIQLGSEQQDRQAGLEADVPVDEPNADGHGDECDTERGSQLEDRAREERDPERLHRRPPIVVAGCGERLGLRAAAVVSAKRGQPANDVQEPCREQRERLCPRSRFPFRVTPDHHHEDRHEGQRHKHHERRRDVDGDHPGEDRNRHDECEDDLRQEPPEVRLQRADAVRGESRDLSALDTVQSHGLVSEPLLDELEAKLGQDTGGKLSARRARMPTRTPPARRIGAPGAGAPSRHRPARRRRTSGRSPWRAGSPGGARESPSRCRRQCRLPAAGAARARPSRRGSSGRTRQRVVGLMPHVLVTEPPGSRTIRPSPLRNAFGAQVMGLTARPRRATSGRSPVNTIRYG